MRLATSRRLIRTYEPLRSNEYPDAVLDYMTQNDTNTDGSLSIVDRAVRFFKSAGEKTESDSERDGFLSYHAESHAAGLGIAAGWFFGATGDRELLSLVYAAAVYGRAKADNGKRRRILRDCAEEPHYCLGGVVIGALAGLITGAITPGSSIGGLEVPI